MDLGNVMEKRARGIVSIINRFLPHYRVDFYSELRKRLMEKDVLLRVYYGKNKNVPKQDEVDIDWGRPMTNWTLRLGKQELYMHPIPRSIWESDLIILAQENRILPNYILFARCLMQGRKIAFWDHGLNLQAASESIGNRFKRLYSAKASWWFAYTARVAQIVADMGFPRERITVVQNAIDTRRLILNAEGITEAQILKKRKEMGIGNGPIGLYCGGLYKEKRIDFLLESCRCIRREIPSFELIVIGAGPDSHLVRSASLHDPWIHYLGPLFGAEKIPYFKMSSVFLIPGLVGLAILDSFALEIPLITAQFSFHSPEIEYLIPDVNGIMTHGSLDSFVSGVLRVLFSPDLQSRLRQGCREGARKYTLENMVKNFGEGVEKALTFAS